MIECRVDGLCRPPTNQPISESMQQDSHLAGIVLQITFLLTALLGAVALASPEELSLEPLPHFSAAEEETRADKYDAPLPGDARVAEDLVVDDGDVDEGEHADEADHDGPEEERVVPDVPDPLGGLGPLGGVGGGAHVEQGPAEVDHLPGKEEDEPGQTGESGATSAEDKLATLEVVVAVGAEVTVTETVDDKGECAQADGGDPAAVGKHVDDHFPSKDAALETR